MKNSERTVNIREIQHYFYCPHRWGLVYIACDWSENFFVNKAEIIHDRVDSGKPSFLRGIYTERAVEVYNDEWGLFGVLDCLQLIPDDGGCYIEKYGKKFSLKIVEYKPSTTLREQASIADKMQLLAQKICVDKMFRTNCSACLYHADTRRQTEISFEQSDYDSLAQAIGEIRQHYAQATIPPISGTCYCGGCSMKDICLPKTRCTNA